ncbi:arginase [Paenibacillus frigoriresistens]|uniref:arginase n=1 Tax=Paenibacillus alginolyticus TaxID=59839 RepID=UPI001565D1BF|nr:arginase [Paenibacillus frigoriresistens]NRF93335.1 arginase [Paenibacillus frigoriresistens]
MMENDKQLTIIQVSFGLGSGRTGTELGSDSLEQAGLLRQIRKTEYGLAGVHKVKCPEIGVFPTNQAKDAVVKHFPEVMEMSRLVAKHVSQAALQGTFPLVLGGDHSVTIGTLAGLTTRFVNLGVIYFDAHVGLNTEDTSPMGNMNRMTLAAALGKSEFKLTDIPGTNALIKRENVVIIGVRDVEQSERDLVLSEGITCFTMHEIDRMGIEKVMEKALQTAGNGTDGIHLSFDIDSLDPLEAPGVSMSVPGGLTYREAHFAFELLATSGLITSMDVVELNPTLDESRRTARLAVGLIASILGKRIL